MKWLSKLKAVTVGVALCSAAWGQVSPAMPIAAATSPAASASGDSDKSSTAPRPAAQLAPAANFDQVIDRVIASETRFADSMTKYTPLVETYVQRMTSDPDLGQRPASDGYFIGKLELARAGRYDASLLPRPRVKKSDFLGVLAIPTAMFHLEFLPMGFAQMIVPDNRGLNRAAYNFTFVRREFLGDVRCIVIDVAPKSSSDSGRFLGRIWVEDQDYNIVRFNGTYTSGRAIMTHKLYFHFDSWRLNMAPGQWLPAYVYTEESDLKYGYGIRSARFKAQTRLWNYDRKLSNPNSEFTDMVVDDQQVRDSSTGARDLSPLESERAWQRQAEDNVLDRLTKAGLLAQPGDAEKVLGTVINNLEVTNNLDIQPDVRARVLLTTPMESFFVGHTIVLSRGMIDVLPDEATLAAVLAHELAHISLGHKFDTKYAFADRIMFEDEQAYTKLNFHENSADEEAADKKALEILRNSPYKDKLASVGLFLKALDSRRGELSNLLRAHLGNTLMVDGQPRMNELTTSAPELQVRNLNQLPALPLGGRLHLDPYCNRLSLSNNPNLPLISPKEKLSFEVTPLFPHLTRLAQPAQEHAAISQK